MVAPQAGGHSDKVVGKATLGHSIAMATHEVVEFELLSSAEWPQVQVPCKTARLPRDRPWGPYKGPPPVWCLVKNVASNALTRLRGGLLTLSHTLKGGQLILRGGKVSGSTKPWSS